MALTRSEQMARIRGSHTSPEVLLREELAVRGITAEPYVRTSHGRPDLFVPASRTAVFIDGCFWHGCPEHYVRPRSRGDFWAEKLSSNVARDRRQTLGLEAEGYRVLRVWEHEVFESLDVVVARVEGALAQEDAPACWRIARVEVIDEATDLERQHLVDLRHVDRMMTRERTRSTRKWQRKGSR